MPQSIDYATDQTITPEQLAEIFKQSGIRRPVDDFDRLMQMISHADILLTAWDGQRLVGVARAITDFSFCCYLSDLAVDRAYQRRGIGKELLRMLRERVGEQVMILLLSAPEAESYYPGVGFEKAPNAWRISRRT